MVQFLFLFFLWSFNSFCPAGTLLMLNSSSGRGSLSTWILVEKLSSGGWLIFFSYYYYLFIFVLFYFYLFIYLFIAGHISLAAGMVCVAAWQGTLVISPLVSTIERRVEIWLVGTPEKKTVF